MMARAWQLTSRPVGVPSAENFSLVDHPETPLSDGEVRVANRWLSVDPYMRGRMNDERSYVAPFQLDEPLTGGAVGRVIESRSPDFTVGDLVSHGLGWRDVSFGRATDFRKLPSLDVPDEKWLGQLGMIGQTAYVGLLRVAQAVQGDTVFVSAAAGAVGAVVVQIAKLKDMTVIGSAGGEEKCAYLREIGADVAIDYKAPGSLADKLTTAAPDGIDVYFDNVGGEHLEAAINSANVHARFAICGMIGGYNSKEPVAMRHLMRIVQARIRIEGFLVGDHQDIVADFFRDMSEWTRAGLVRTRETVSDGLEATPEAFIGLFTGQNLGKALVRLPGPDS